MTPAANGTRTKRPLEVAIVAVHVRQGDSGSNEPYVTGLLRGLAATDPSLARFTVHATKWLGTWPEHGPTTSFVFHRVPGLGHSYASYGLRVLQEWQVAIRTHADVLLFAGTSGAPLARCPQVAVVHWDNRLQPHSAPFLRSLGNSAMMRIIRSRSARVIVPTASYADFLARAWGFDRRKLVPIHHGVDIPPSMQRRGGRGANAIAVLNDLPHKNLPVLLRAFGLVLAGSRDPICLTLVGKISTAALDTVGVPWRDWESDSRLVRTAWLSHPEVLDLVASAEMLVSPSEGETFCMPLVEAMAVGTPVVTADTPVAREVCGDAAVYAELRSARALADAILRVHDDSVLQAQMSDAGLQRAVRLTWDNAAREVVDLLLDVCGPLGRVSP